MTEDRVISSPNPTDITPIATVDAITAQQFVPIIEAVDVRNGVYKMTWHGPVASFVINRQVVAISLSNPQNSYLEVDPAFAGAARSCSVIFGPSATDGIQSIKQVQEYDSSNYEIEPGTSLIAITLKASYDNILPNSVYSRDRWVCQITHLYPVQVLQYVYFTIQVS